MRSILLLPLLGALAAPAAAGDVSFDFGFRKGGRSAFSIAFGYSDHHEHVTRHVHREVVHRKWVPGHYETVTRRVWVEGACEQVWQPAEYGWRYDPCGRRVRVLLRPAGYVMVHRPGHWTTVQETVWVPGRYVRC